MKMRTSLRALAALFEQAVSQKVQLDDSIQLIDNAYSTTILKGEDIVAYKGKPQRSKDVALEQAEQDHLQRMRESGDERPENQ